mgnify:CR=1 FL=1
MLNFKIIKFNSSQKVEVLDGKKTVMIINIEYYDKSNIEIVKNLQIFNLCNELLPIHYTFKIRKNRYFKKIMMFSQPKTLGMKLENLGSIASNDLSNMYKKIIRIIGKNNKVTLLISNVTKEVLYTSSKVYKTEF